MNPLRRTFYARDTLEVAHDLLGKVLIHERRGARVAGRIVEVEAYLGSEDEASHSFRGPTDRNRAMFGPPGHAYVYFTYGNHFCMNIVAGTKPEGTAVLVRALEPLEGLQMMKRRRKRKLLRDLTRGPGRLTQAMGIDLRCNHLDLTKKPLWIIEDGFSPERIITGPRIGITRAVRLPYRFFLPESSFVSIRP